MSGPMSGTPIAELNNMQQIQYDSMHNYQHEQGHNAAHQMSQSQHAPYYNTENCNGYPSFNRPPQQHQVTYPPLAAPHQPDLDIDEITRDLGDLPTVSETGLEGLEESNDSVLSFIPKMFREPIVIFVIYILLSQNVVQSTLAKYIEQLRPNEITGAVPMIGRVIYGLILAALFMLAKKFIL